MIGVSFLKEEDLQSKFNRNHLIDLRFLPLVQIFYRSGRISLTFVATESAEE